MTKHPLHIQTPRGIDREGLSGGERGVGCEIDHRACAKDELVRSARLTGIGACHQSLRNVRNCASGRMLTPVVAKRRGRGAFLVEARGFHEQE